MLTFRILTMAMVVLATEMDGPTFRSGGAVAALRRPPLSAFGEGSALLTRVSSRRTGWLGCVSCATFYCPARWRTRPSSTVSSRSTPRWRSIATSTPASQAHSKYRHSKYRHSFKFSSLADPGKYSHGKPCHLVLVYGHSRTNPHYITASVYEPHYITLSCTNPPTTKART